MGLVGHGPRAKAEAEAEAITIMIIKNNGYSTHRNQKTMN